MTRQPSGLSATLAAAATDIRDKVKRPRLRLASFDDYEQIRAVQAANGLSTKPRPQWLHLWENNPAYWELPGWPAGWVLEDEGGATVGALENVPCLYRLAGRTYVCAFGRGWAVEPAYRVYALQLIVSQMRQPNVDLLITTTAGSRTMEVLTRSGWSQAPVGRWDRSAVWVTNYAETARSCLVRTPRLVSSLAGPILSAALRWKDAAPWRSRRSEGRWKLQWCADFDERFELFWEELEERNSGRMLAVRSAQTLRWHFKYALQENRLAILSAYDGGRMIAYAVFERRPVPSLAAERALLVDFQTLVADRELVGAMISIAVERYREDRVPIMENAGCWLEATQPLTNRPRFRRVLGSWSYLYYAKNPELAAGLRDPEAWYPTQFDADASL
jgi:hypothetical protein